MTIKGKKLYINKDGKTDYFCPSEVPEGFYLAEIFYINNGVSNKRWYRGVEIPDGYKEGKLPLSRNWTPEQHKHHSEEAKANISKARKAQGTSWWIGRHHSETTKQKMSEYKTGKPGNLLGYKYSEEQKQLKKHHIIDKYGSLENFYDLKSEAYRKTVFERYGVINISQTQNWKDKVSKTCIERYGVPYACMREEARAYSNDSKPNQTFAKLLDDNGIEYSREFNIGKLSYDFKVGNLLIEIDPTITHNSTLSPFVQGPIDKDYHINKSKLAEDNGFRCIHVFDWDDLDKIISILKLRKRIYARNCEIKLVEDVKEVNTFLNTYHLQGTCKNQSVCIGLYYEGEFVSIMTFGKPRYNKNYQYELLRYCSKHLVVGGEEKLFKYFLDNYNPESIISYCDRSKFNGKIYNKLGFTGDSNYRPSLHWYNMSTGQHITDNLLRQRGFDQLFNTNYGKGTSNEELMLEHEFVKVYDCGQQTFTYRSSKN